MRSVDSCCFRASAAAEAPSAAMQHEWWQWVMSIPSSDSPVYDKTGNRCGIAQRGNTWYLAGSTGGKVTRKCAIPGGVSLLVPVVNTFCFPDASYSDSACTTESHGFIDSFGTYELTVDGNAVTPTRLKDDSDFKFTVGYNGYGGVKPGTYRATVADGYWGLVGPLTPGRHEIHIVAQGPYFSLDVTYDLDVVSPAN